MVHRLKRVQFGGSLTAAHALLPRVRPAAVLGEERATSRWMRARCDSRGTKTDAVASFCPRRALPHNGGRPKTFIIVVIDRCWHHAAHHDASTPGIHDEKASTVVRQRRALLPRFSRGAMSPAVAAPPRPRRRSAGWLLDVGLYSVVLLHMLLAPFTKVEESFGVQACHDALAHGFGAAGLSKWDHHEFPGAVPRSFLGAMAAATLARAPLGAFAALARASAEAPPLRPEGARQRRGASRAPPA